MSVGYGDLTTLQLSVYRGSSGVQAIMNSNARKLAEQDESVVVALGIPYTIVRTGLLTNDRGDKPGFSFEEVFSWCMFSLKKGKNSILCGNWFNIPHNRVVQQMEVLARKMLHSYALKLLM